MHGKGEAPAIRILEEAGEDVGRLEYRFVERGGTKDAARQLGLCEHDIVKSLVFDDGKGGQAVMALMHGDERVSLHKLQRLSGVPHLQPSSPENAERLTGYKPGGICRSGSPCRFRCSRRYPFSISGCCTSMRANAASSPSSGPRPCGFPGP